MRIFLLLTSFLFALSASTQIIELSAWEAGELKEEAKVKLKEQIGDAEIVVIGEQVHGMGTDYKNFATFVKFLHEEMDFNVVAQEFCFYSFGELQIDQKDAHSAQIYRSAMYWPQAKGDEYDSLYNYVDEEEMGGEPLYLEGLDPRIFFKRRYYSYLSGLVQAQTELFTEEEQSQYLSTLDLLLELEYNDTSSLADQVFFLSSTDSLITSYSRSKEEPRLIQQMRNLKAYAKNAWNWEGEGMKAVDRFHHRSRQMAENVIWLKEKLYPNEKIIVRLHNGHAAKNFKALKGFIPDSLFPETPNVGSLIHEKYGDKAYFMGSTFYSGTFCSWDYEPQFIPQPKEGSLESELHKKGYKYALVPLEEETEYQLFFNEFNFWMKDAELTAPFGKLFDAIIFMDHGVAPEEIR